MAEAKFIIGIDLGTTNSTLAYIKRDETAPQQLAISQLIDAGCEGEAYSLPSFVYLPLSEELSQGLSAVSWDPERTLAVGQYAQKRGEEVPDRVIASAKSWLCHEGVDRREALLPLHAEEGGARLSPLDACTALLCHLKEVWDCAQPESPFEQQVVLVTVPASFTPGARQLVQEAAEQAAYPEIILLEEPQAAFYAWLQQEGDGWRQHLTVGDTVLVVDIGGGTTDFSLIEVGQQEGDLELSRLAVGSHLLLGGDNMDLALAHSLRLQLEEEGQILDDWQFHQLIHSCRQAKERLLGKDAPESVDLSIQGRGSGLVGGTIRTQLLESQVHALLVDGFFPLVSAEERAATEKRLGLSQVGLPYAQDARITCQLAKFLAMTGEGDSSSMEHFVLPTHVLFNGGTMKAQALQERIMDQLRSWAKELQQVEPKALTGGDLDYAVSRGASYYGVARQGQAIRIRGGTSRSYYIGVEEAGLAIPGVPPALRAVCVVPFGMEEGSEEKLEGREFSLVLGELATFRFFSRETPTLSTGESPKVGTEVRLWKQELTELHPLETLLDREEGDAKTVCVRLVSKVTELGVLELFCQAADGRSWKLEFETRFAPNPVAEAGCSAQDTSIPKTCESPILTMRDTQ